MAKLADAPDLDLVEKSLAIFKKFEAVSFLYLRMNCRV